jgi:dihydroxyacetone kinase-like predicted kinase
LGGKMEKTDNQIDDVAKRITEIAIEVLNDKIIYSDSDLDDLLNELQSRLSKELNMDVELYVEYDGEEEGNIYLDVTITTPHGRYSASVVLEQAYKVSLGFDVYSID